MLPFTQNQPWLPILTPNSLMAKESEDIKQRAPGQLGFLAPQNRSCPHPVTETCFREWCVGTISKNLDTALCSIGKNNALPPVPRGAGTWAWGSELRPKN